MKFQFTHPLWLLALPLALGWVVWLIRTSDVHLSPVRRWTVAGLRCVIVSALILALAGLQWLRPIEGMNVFFLLDRSDSVVEGHQETAREFVTRISGAKQREDKAGVVVFGTDAGIEFTPSTLVDLQLIQAVVGTERTDIGGAIRLATAAFPEIGQKRIVLLSDGNENIGDAINAALAAQPLGVSIDVAPLGAVGGGDMAVERLALPGTVKKGQTFEVKIFAESERAQPAMVRLYRNEQFMGEQEVQLAPGKNLFTFPETLQEEGFYAYDVAIEGAYDRIAQNNRASGFSFVRGDPKVLLVTSSASADERLVEVLRSAPMHVRVVAPDELPAGLAELQSYDSLFLSNVAAGDLGRDRMLLIESAVRDFGVGLVCLGGDQAYAAGGYRRTPLEDTLPVDMELSSKKVLPNGALVMVMHGMEFNNGNQVARDIALGALEALGPQDEIGVVLWDGQERWLVELQKASNKQRIGRTIAGMNQGDLPSFQGVMTMAYEGLRRSNANLKHMIVFSDGDPGPPSEALMQQITEARITVSTVLIAGHAGPQTMIWIADKGGGRFYNVANPQDLPQVFIKETAVILKSAIFEEPFRPQLALSSEMVRGIGAGEYPQLLGYVATTPKPRAEIPLLSESGDPVLAHWQYGLGRAVAFTSDARPKWAAHWLTWERYRQFWTQVAQWSLRRLDNSELTAEASLENGRGQVRVEALDAEGNFRNFLNLQAIVSSPKGERQTVVLDQTGPGHYEAAFETKEVGTYMIHLLDLEGEQIRGSQVLGASINYSPEYSAAGPNLNLLKRVADATGGRMLDVDSSAENPFLHDRVKTNQPMDLWEWLLQFAVLLFVADVGVRRVQVDRDEWLRATQNLRRLLFFWKPRTAPVAQDESLAALLARKTELRSAWDASRPEPNPDLFRPSGAAEGIESVADERKPSAMDAPSPAEEPQAKTSESTASRLLEAKRRAQQRRKR